MLDLLIGKSIDNGLKNDILVKIINNKNIKIYILIGLLTIGSFINSKKINSQEDRILYLEQILEESETKGE